MGQTAIPRGVVVGTPAPLSVFGSVRLAGNRMKSLSLGLGVVLSAILLFRVISGHDNTWDVGLWLASITLLGALFAPEFRWRATGHGPSNLIARGWATARRNWRAVIPLLVLLVVFCAVVAPNLTAWRYAALGDEYLFYEHAKSVIESGTTIPFSQNGVYDHHPVLNTLYKAVWMRLFGDDHFGWKMTGVVSMALSISGVYVLAGLLWDRGTAVVAAGLFAASHYLLGLLNGGYNHVDALPVTVWTLVAFGYALRRGSPWLLFLAGVGVGMGFYFHYSARIVGPVMLLVALMTVRPRDYLRLWPIAAGFAVTAWPTILLAQEQILTKMFAQTAAGYSEVVAGPLSDRLMSNLQLNLPAVFFSNTSHTYVGGALLDPISGALVAIGLGLAIGTWNRLASKLCLIWLVISFLATGLTSPYPTTAVTRLFPMMPPLALLAGMASTAGYRVVESRVRQLSGKWLGISATVAMVALLGSVLFLNQYRALVSTHEDFHYTRAALAVGAFRSPQCEAQTEQIVFVGARPDSTLSKAVNSYDPDGGRATVVPYADFSDGELLPNPACVILHDASSHEARRVMADLQDRFPSGALYTFTTPSRKSDVQFFHIPRS